GARRVGEPAEGARRAAEPAEGARRVRLPLAKKDIASYLGTTPESLSRSLARLQSSGAIQVEGDVVELLDVEALEELAEGA
ncbi:MAG TPA: winged helix-turn-helix domain-containing protein, partial [Actinomycetales bacterium]|nr:winged helix-turn-helix domain-containing protein [Actinomycetales bacterium]